MRELKREKRENLRGIAWDRAWDRAQMKDNEKVSELRELTARACHVIIINDYWSEVEVSLGFSFCSFFWPLIIDEVCSLIVLSLAAPLLNFLLTWNYNKYLLLSHSVLVVVCLGIFLVFVCFLDHQGKKIVKPRHQTPKPKNTKPRGLGLTLKSHRPPPHPITFKHEGGVKQ